MPDTRLAKARRSLPEGYQFGDAKPVPESLKGATLLVNGVEYVLGQTVMIDGGRPQGARYVGFPPNSHFDEASGWRLDA